MCDIEYLSEEKRFEIWELLKQLPFPVYLVVMEGKETKDFLV